MMKSSSFPLGFVATLTKTEWNGVISSSVLCVSRLSEWTMLLRQKRVCTGSHDNVDKVISSFSLCFEYLLGRLTGLRGDYKNLTRHKRELQLVHVEIYL